MDTAVARKLLIKSKVYRVFALAFAVLGLIVFSVLFYNQSGGDFTKAMGDPLMIVILIFSFFPAATFSWLSSRLESKLAKMLGDVSQEES